MNLVGTTLKWMLELTLKWMLESTLIKVENFNQSEVRIQVNFHDHKARTNVESCLYLPEG